MRYHIEMDGQQAAEDQAQRYAMEVHADHRQEARAIALVRAQEVGLDVDLNSVEVSTGR